MSFGLAKSSVKKNNQIKIQSIDKLIWDHPNWFWGVPPARADMQINRYKYFRWNARTAWVSVAYMVIFPSLIGFIAYKTDVRKLAHFLRCDLGMWIGGNRRRGKLSLFPPKKVGSSIWSEDWANVLHGYDLNRANMICEANGEGIQ